MKLAIVTHKVIRGDGQGRVNYEIAWEALCRGHHVTLVASEIAPELREHRCVHPILIPVHLWPTELLRNQLFAIRSASWLRRHRRELDLVHLNGFISWEPGDVNTSHFVHAAWLRSPVHTMRLCPDIYGVYQWLYTVSGTHLERIAYRQAKVVVAVSEKIRHELVEIGIPADRIRVIPNGVDVHEFSPFVLDRRELGLPQGVSIALFVGDIRTPLKNLDTLMKALLQVPALHLLVVGSPEGSPYPQLAVRLGLAGRVHFLGYRRDVARIMRASDVFVLPSRYESFSLVLLEAMASGLPVITARTVGAADLVTPECGIVLHDPNDTDALAQALRRLVESPAQRERMGQAARAVAEGHSWQRMAGEYLQVYEKILEEKRAWSEEER